MTTLNPPGPPAGHAGKLRHRIVPSTLYNELIGRNFLQPKQGLGFDGSPVAHMWRTMIWPTRFL